MTRPSRRLRIAIGAGVVVAALPCLATSLVQRGWRAETAAALAGLEADELGTSLEALGVDGPPTPAAVALAPLLDVLADLPPAVSLMKGAGPVEVHRYMAGDRTVAVYDRAEDDLESPADVKVAMALLLARVARYEKPLDGLLRAKRPIRFQVAWGEGYVAELPHLYGLKSMAQGLRTRAAWRAHEGDSAGAWADAERLTRLVGCLDDPLLTSRLVRCALLAIATSTITELLELCPPPPPEQRARLDATLAGLEDHRGYQRALRGELGMFDRAVELRGGELHLEGQAIPVGIEARLHMERWKRDFALTMASFIRALREPDGLKRHTALEALAAEARSSTVLAQLLLPTFVHAHVKELDAIARLRLTRVALRLGGDPSASPGELPVDPWDGGARLRWASEAGVGRLWSVGEDRKDDGGALPPEPAPDAPPVAPTDLVVRVGRRR